MYGALALHAKHNRLCTEPIHRSHKQQHGAVRLVRVDLQLDFFARLIFLFLRDQFQIIEPILAAVVRGASHEQHIAAFYLVAFAVRDLDTDAELARHGNRHLQIPGTVVVRRDIPRLHFLLNWFVAFVLHREQSRLAAAFDGLVVRCTSLKCHVDRVTCLIVASIGPREDLERIPSHQHAAIADNRAA